MKIVNILLITSFLIFLSSCGGVSQRELSKGGQNVNILSSNRNTGCDVTDKVVGISDIGSIDLAKNHARNLGAKSGGNAIFFDEIIPNGSEVKVFATVYKCN